MAAMASGDVAATIALLHPDVTFTGDSNRRAPTAARVIHGPDKVARFLFGLAQRYGPAFVTTSRLALINGELGAYTSGSPGDDGHQVMMPRITAVTVRAVQNTASSRTLVGNVGDADWSRVSWTALLTSSRG